MRAATTRLVLTLAIAASAAGGALAAPETVNFPVTVRRDQLTLDGKLYRPATGVPRPAVIVVHGCSGQGSSARTWGGVLSTWGYVALVIDSFTGRGVKQVCTRAGGRVDARDRAWDIHGAASWLKTQAFVQTDRLGLMGQSHGGAATLFATLRDRADKSPPPTPAFTAAIAFYPDCSLRGRTAQRFEVLRPLLILIGEKDDWTPADRCRDLLPRLSGKPIELHTYPDAVHAYDNPGSRLRYRAEVNNRNKPGGCCGAWVGYNEPAYRDTLDRVRAFWRLHLDPPG
jgi:dienelactone hydrolase